MEQDRDGKRRNHAKARWCVDAARYTATILLAVLVLAVIAGAVVASLRSQQLNIYVARGYVSVAGLPPASNSSSTSLPPPGNVSLSLVLVISNPSGRADVTYNKSRLLVTDNNNKVIYSSPDAVVQVGPKEVLELSVTFALDEHSPVSSMATLVQMMNGTKTAKVSLSGMLETHFTGLLSFITPSPHLADYNCSQVTIGRLPQRKVRAAGAADLYCQDLNATKWQ